MGKKAFSTDRAPHTYFGDVAHFDDETFRQIEKVERLPVTERTALLPDAHPGYGMPIGGVASLYEAIAPGFVGYDIACRMMVTILDIDPYEFLKNREQFAQFMLASSNFGLNSHYVSREQKDHPVMDDQRWTETVILRKLKPLAREQLGTSGSGNHFFDAMIGKDVLTGQDVVAIMTHSGSRGVGYKIASHYIQLAKQETQKTVGGISKGYEWLSMNRGPGREYFRAMSLMGAFAQANHDIIHDEFLARSGIPMLRQFENHHNFAWVEGSSVIHRKGATPAHQSQIGIIPGSSGTASFITRGLGNKESLESCSHGAGRISSRSEARRRFNAAAFARYMKEKDILGFGVAPDESWKAYKDIEEVIRYQVKAGLLGVVMRLEPTIVVMGGGRVQK